MKGITHFCAGIAIGSSIPGVVSASANGNPTYFIIASLMSMIPDFIDFKLLSYFTKVQGLVIPDYKNFDPQSIAEGIAGITLHAHLTGKAQTIRLCTVRTSADEWLKYSVTFRGSEIEVQSDDFPNRRGISKVHVPFHCSYESTIEISILTGPTITIVPCKNYTRIDFLKWHRGFSHSIITALIISAIISLTLNLTAGVTGMLAYLSHILLDQTGHMGSALWWPFNKEKRPGMSLCHSTSMFANIFTIIMSCLILYANLFRYRFPEHNLQALRIVILPALTMILIHKIKTFKEQPK